MRNFWTLFSILLLAILATARFAESAAVTALLHPPYGARLLSAVGILTAIAAAVVLDRLVRDLYWNGHLRRRRGRETPAVIEGLFTIALLLLGASIGLYFEAGVSFTGLVTASGATAVILGIALQAVISDVFSGVSVNIDGSFAIGDWLTIYSEQFPEPIYGRVQGISWRTTFLRLSDGCRLIIPNHVLTSNPVMNHSNPRGPKRLCVEVPVSNRFPADRAMTILLSEAYRITSTKPLSSAHDPEVLVSHLDSDAVHYHVRFYSDLEGADPQKAKSIMTKALHRALQRYDVPTPVSQVELVSQNGGPRDGGAEAREALAQVSLFENILRSVHLDALVSACAVRTIPPGAVFIQQGEAGTSMFVLLEGAARVAIAMPDGERREVAVLGGGDIVGEMSLMTGAPRTASVTSLTPLRILEVTKESMEPLLAGEPGLLDRFSHVLAVRQSSLSAIANAASQKQTLQHDILAQMRQFFSRAFR